ncbi:MAG: hypothetical protein ACK5HS_04725 [Mycoplasmatales bacterium]
MKRLYPCVVYTNNELSVQVYSVLEEQTYFLGEKSIIVQDIRDISGDPSFSKLGSKVKDAFLEFEQELSVRFTHIFVLVEPYDSYYNRREFSADFKEDHKVDAVDFDKIIAKGLRHDEANQGFTVSDFAPIKIFVNDREETPSQAIGKKPSKLSIEGDLIFNDSNTMYPLGQILDCCSYEVKSYLTTTHLLSYLSGFADKEAVVEFERNKMNIIVKTNDQTQIFAIDLGTSKFFEKTFLELITEHSQEESEAALRYLQNHFVLHPVKYDIQITDNISLNRLIEIFTQRVATDIQGVIVKLAKEGISIRKMYVTIFDYDQREWVEFLKNTQEIEIEQFKVKNANTFLKDKQKILHAITYYDSKKVI